MARKGRRRQDHLARRAQREGYEARSVYKLEEIDRRHQLLGRSRRVLDVGAAPGSWTRFALERGCNVVSVDLKEMEVDGAYCLHGDFTEAAMAAVIAERAPYDLVMSDAAPDTSGNRLVDTGRSEAIVESLLAMLDGWLAPGGDFVAKLFQGGGEQALVAQVRERFTRGLFFRPKAVRSESFETYLVGRGFTGIS